MIRTRWASLGGEKSGEKGSGVFGGKRLYVRQELSPPKTPDPYASLRIAA